MSGRRNMFMSSMHESRKDYNERIRKENERNRVAYNKKQQANYNELERIKNDVPDRLKKQRLEEERLRDFHLYMDLYKSLVKRDMSIDEFISNERNSYTATIKEYKDDIAKKRSYNIWDVFILRKNTDTAVEESLVRDYEIDLNHLPKKKADLEKIVELMNGYDWEYDVKVSEGLMSEDVAKRKSNMDKLKEVTKNCLKYSYCNTFKYYSSKY